MPVAYAYDGTLYLAVTRRCTLACTFCPKIHGRWVVAGNDMSRDKEPTLEELLAAARAIDAVTPSLHVAFVGLGEPTMRLDLVTAAGRALRAEGHHVRLVTDGLANLRAGHDVTPELAGALDEVSVSLNAPDGEAYAQLCPNKYGAAAHAAVCDFICAAKAHVPKVVASVVTAPGIDVPATEALAARLGVPLRVRPWFDPLAGEPHEPQPAAR
jgi:TatD DNase family protein